MIIFQLICKLGTASGGGGMFCVKAQMEQIYYVTSYKMLLINVAVMQISFTRQGIIVR
jgi:hypothetical protein